MHDVFCFITRPFHVGLTRSQRRRHGVNAGHKRAINAQHVVHRAPHARHDALVDCNISAVAEFNTNVGNVGAQRAHGKRHHIHGAATHTAVKQGGRAVSLAGLQQGAHFGRCHPVVGRACVFFLFAANIGAVFNPGDVAGVRAGQEAVGAFDRVEFFESSRVHQLLAKALVFFFRSIAPVDGSRFAQRHHFCNPCNQACVFDMAGCVQGQALHCGCVHELLQSLKSSFPRKRKRRHRLLGKKIAKWPYSRK